MQDAEVEVRREPGRAVVVWPVPLDLVVVETLGRNACQRRHAASSPGSAARTGLGHGLLSTATAGGSESAGAGRGRGACGRSGQPRSRQARAKRGEDLIGIAGAIPDRPGPTAYGEPLATRWTSSPTAASRRRPYGVVSAATWTGLRRRQRRPGRRRRVAVPDRQWERSARDRTLAASQPVGRTGAGPDGRIDDEQGGRRAVLEGGEQRRVVADRRSRRNHMTEDTWLNVAAG